jgi:hypothetical protein
MRSIEVGHLTCADAVADIENTQGALSLDFLSAGRKPAPKCKCQWPNTCVCGGGGALIGSGPGVPSPVVQSPAMRILLVIILLGVGQQRGEFVRKDLPNRMS